LPRGIKAELQSPRTKLLYFIYLAPGSRIKNEPGIKSKIRKALGYKSDGHFYHDWEYLLRSSMLMEEGGYFVVTDKGKEEFAFCAPNLRHNFLIIGIGMMLIFLYGLVIRGALPQHTIGVFGVILIFLGYFLLMFSKRNEPELPFKAKILLRKIKRQKYVF